MPLTCTRSLQLLSWRVANTQVLLYGAWLQKLEAGHVVRWERVTMTTSVVCMGGLCFYQVFAIGQADPRKTASVHTSSSLALSLRYTSFVCMSTILAGQREALPRNQQKWSSTTLFNMQLFLDASSIIICCAIPKGFIGSDEQNCLLESFQEYIKSKVDVIRFVFCLTLQQLQ